MAVAVRRLVVGRNTVAWPYLVGAPKAVDKLPIFLRSKTGVEVGPRLAA